MIKYINGVPNAPAAIGPYSQAVIHDGVAYISGQIPIHPETGEIVEGGIEAQTNQVMKNLLAILGHMNIDFSNVLKTTIFLTDLGQFQTVNAVYSRWIGSVAPARATVEVSALPKGSLIEIELIAAVTSPDHLMLGHGNVEDIRNLEEQLYSAKSDCD